MRRIISLLVLALATTTDHVLAAPAARTAPSAPRVDLGYAVYEGSYNSTFDVNIWKRYELSLSNAKSPSLSTLTLPSIRYAAPPVGKLRWQAPQAPPSATTPDRVVPAVDQPPWCPQSGAFGVPSVYGFNSNLGNEDCLYLNVYAPPQAERLPVLVWIRKFYRPATQSYSIQNWQKLT